MERNRVNQIKWGLLSGLVSWAYFKSPIIINS